MIYAVVNLLVAVCQKTNLIPAALSFYFLKPRNRWP